MSPARAANRGRWSLVFALASALGCGRGGSNAATDAQAGGDAGTTSGVAVATASDNKPSVVLDFVAHADDCSFGLRGPLIDLGEPGTRIRGASNEELVLERVEREGASFARVRERSIVLPFFVTPDDERAFGGLPTVISARIRGGGARAVSLYVNGKPAGSMRPTKGDITVLSATANMALLTGGTNEVQLRFHTGPRVERDVLAEVDWVHVGTSEVEPTFAAPTVRDVVADKSIGGTLEKAIALRTEGSVRCAGFIPSEASLEFDLAGEGGEAEIEARVLRDRVPPLVLGRAKAGTTPSPQRLSIGPGASPGAVGAIEIVAVKTGKGGRALLGSPKLVVPSVPTPPRSEPSRAVVLVVMGTVEPRSLAAYGGAIGVEAIGPFARTGTIFTQHRSSSTLPHAALAAMLTGHGPRANRLEDGDARLPASVTTIADAARQGGVVTAYFTGNPMTSGGYGFDRSWETQEALFADADPTGVRPFDDAAAWIRAHKTDRMLVVVHARGGHPPWGATPEQLKTMQPLAYSGGLDPKHAGELLSKARHVPPQLRFTDADRTRAFALHAAALADQDRAFGRLLAELKGSDREKDTTVIVTGDVGVSTAQAVPFGDGDAPTEQTLATPLLIRGGASFPAGASVATPTTDVDLARTILSALGLSPPKTFEGLDLADIARAHTRAANEALARPLFATVFGRHSLRWGNLVLEANDHRESLCDIALEPLCTTDVRPTHPLAGMLLGARLAAERHAPTPGNVTREPAVLEPRVQAALRAWGR